MDGLILFCLSSFVRAMKQLCNRYRKRLYRIDDEEIRIFFKIEKFYYP